MDAKTPLHILRELISVEGGTSLIEDPRRCKALLLDYCAMHRREVNLLVKAHEEHVPARLLARAEDVTLTVVMAQLAAQLADDWGLAEESARWAVAAWAWALDLIDVPPDESPAAPSERESGAQADAPPASETVSQPHAYVSGQAAPPASHPPVTPPRHSRRGGHRRFAIIPLAVSLGIMLLCCLCMLLCANLTVGRLPPPPAPHRPTALPSPTSSPTPAPSPSPTSVPTPSPAPLSWPETPVLRSPEGQITCEGLHLHINLRWEEPDSLHPVARYRIQVEPGGPMPREAAENTWVLEAPCASDNYRWRVQAEDRRGNAGEWSSWHYFSVDCIGEVCDVGPRD